MPTIQTERLHLVALSLQQLALYLEAPGQLEAELGFPISREVLTPRARRAIAMKIDRMQLAEEGEHPWCTYWLIVTARQPYGAGLAGFKGAPGADGEVEIGYGIDPAHRNRGYMTEAVKALIAWAFADPRCQSVVAPGTERQNLASNRVLEKAGMRIYGETEEALDWRIDRVD